MRALALTLCLAGCASPNLYVSPRPLGAGKVQHAIALEALGGVTPHGAAILPTAPTWQLRIGLSERVDLMARLVNLSGLGIDTLISLYQGPVDVALVPGVRGTWLPFTAGRPGLVSGHLPVLLGVRLGERVSLTGTLGAGFTATLGDSVSAVETAKALAEDDGASSRGVFARGGLGVRIRVAKGLVLHPEVTALWVPETGRVTLSGGVGFVFGALE